MSSTVTAHAPSVSHANLHELRLDLQNFYEDYAACLDDGEIVRWPDFFTEEANYQVISRENYDSGLTHATLYCAGRNMIRDRALAIKEIAVYEPRYLRHIISGVRIHDVKDGTISASANFLITESKSDQDTVIFMAGRYVDSISKVDDGFLFSQRLCVFDNYRIRTTLVFPA